MYTSFRVSVAPHDVLCVCVIPSNHATILKEQNKSVYKDRIYYVQIHDSLEKGFIEAL